MHPRSRLLREIGWWRLLLLGPVLLATLSKVLAAGHAAGQWAVSVVITLLLASAHWQRADLRFLDTIAPKWRRWRVVLPGTS